MRLTVTVYDDGSRLGPSRQNPLAHPRRATCRRRGCRERERERGSGIQSQVALSTCGGGDKTAPRSHLVVMAIARPCRREPGPASRDEPGLALPLGLAPMLLLGLGLGLLLW